MRTPRVYDITPGQAEVNISDAFGDWVGGMADWDWFATMTFRDPSENDQKAGWTRIGTGYARTALRKWSDSLQRACFGSDQPRWMACMEFQKDRGVPHWHALVSGTGDQRRMDWVDWWYHEYGIARVLPYDKKLGARYYLSKYVTKSMADIQFSVGLTCDLKRPIDILPEKC
jgi:hypothetical protein